MLEDYEASISLTRRTRSSKKPLGMQEKIGNTNGSSHALQEPKETIKNARKKLETPVAPAMPCKILKKKCGSGASNKIKTRLACVLEACEPTRLRMEESLPKFIHYSITIWYTNLFICTKL